VETVEKSQFDFPTVSTALGKLSTKRAPSFPQFPQLRLLDYYFLKPKKGTNHNQWKWSELQNYEC
jgi:hypothetical protein